MSEQDAKPTEAPSDAAQRFSQPVQPQRAEPADETPAKRPQVKSTGVPVGKLAGVAVPLAVIGVLLAWWLVGPMLALLILAAVALALICSLIARAVVGRPRRGGTSTRSTQPSVDTARRRPFFSRSSRSAVGSSPTAGSPTGARGAKSTAGKPAGASRWNRRNSAAGKNSAGTPTQGNPGTGRTSRDTSKTTTGRATTGRSQSAAAGPEAGKAPAKASGKRGLFGRRRNQSTSGSTSKPAASTPSGSRSPVRKSGASGGSPSKAVDTSKSPAKAPETAKSPSKAAGASTSTAPASGRSRWFGGRKSSAAASGSSKRNAVSGAKPSSGTSTGSTTARRSDSKDNAGEVRRGRGNWRDRNKDRRDTRGADDRGRDGSRPKRDRSGDTEPRDRNTNKAPSAKSNPRAEAKQDKKPKKAANAQRGNTPAAVEVTVKTENAVKPPPSNITANQPYVPGPIRPAPKPAPAATHNDPRMESLAAAVRNAGKAPGASRQEGDDMFAERIDTSTPETREKTTRDAAEAARRSSVWHDEQADRFFAQADVLMNQVGMAGAANQMRREGMKARDTAENRRGYAVAFEQVADDFAAQRNTTAS